MPIAVFPALHSHIFCTHPHGIPIIQIQHILDNDFYSTRFSFDINGYPNNVSVDIFTSEKSVRKGKKAYSFEYATEFNTENPDIQNNIKDYPNAFEIKYE